MGIHELLKELMASLWDVFGKQGIRAFGLSLLRDHVRFDSGV